MVWIILIAVGLSLWTGVSLLLDASVRRWVTSPGDLLLAWYRSERLAREAQEWLQAQVGVERA